MTICIFTAQFFPVAGGVERYSYNLARELVRQGHRAIIVASNTSGMPETEVLDGIPVYRLPCWNLLRGRMPVDKPGRRRRELLKAVAAEKPDGVLVNTRLYTHSLVGARFGARQGVPCLLLDHSTGHFSVGNAVADAVGHVYEHALTALLKRRCAGFYGVSKACCGWLSHFGIRAKGVLYNAVDAEEIARLATAPRVDFRRRCAVPQSAVAVAYVGRLVEEKGVRKLAAAVKAANKNGGKFFLFIAGEGPLFAEFASEQDSCAAVLGRLAFPDVAALLSQSDIFVLPTEYPEGFPTSVLEAAAAGCFCITTTAGGSAEFITSEEYGVILQDNTEEALRRALEDAAARPEKRRAAAGAARVRVGEEFTWEKTALATVAALQQAQAPLCGTKGAKGAFEEKS